MNRILLMLFIIIVIVAAGAFGYKEYRDNQSAAAQITSMQSTQSTLPSSADNRPRNNQVDKNASPQEQQMEEQLNSLDSSNHN